MTRIEGVLQKLTGCIWNVRIESASGEVAAAIQPQETPEETAPPQSRLRRQRQEVLQKPLVKKAVELLGAQILDMEEGFGTAPEIPTVPLAVDDTEEL